MPYIKFGTNVNFEFSFRDLEIGAWDHNWLKWKYTKCWSTKWIHLTMVKCYYCVGNTTPSQAFDKNFMLRKQHFLWRKACVYRTSIRHGGYKGTARTGARSTGHSWPCTQDDSSLFQWHCPSQSHQGLVCCNNTYSSTCTVHVLISFVPWVIFDFL